MNAELQSHEHEMCVLKVTIFYKVDRVIGMVKVTHMLSELLKPALSWDKSRRHVVT